MKPKDFMIGNWVLVDGKPEQITGVDRKYIHLEGNVSTILLEGEVEPIPLTKEIMQKNFPTPNFLKWWPIEENENCFEVEINVNSTIIHAFFEKVHKLQQALRLCKWDKIIEL